MNKILDKDFKESNIWLKMGNYLTMQYSVYGVISLLSPTQHYNYHYLFYIK